MFRTDMNFNGIDQNAFVVGFPIVFAIFQLILLPFVFDSPDSLEQRGLNDQADIARNFYGLCEKYSIWSGLQKVNPIPSIQAKRVPFHTIIRDPEFYKPLIVGCVMMMIQQLTGIRKGSASKSELKVRPINSISPGYNNSEPNKCNSFLFYNNI